jgi:hypothetical protein
MATIQGVYVALFGRPADPLGLAYFNEETQDGADLTAIGDLAATAEFQARFEGQTNQQIVTSIYQSLFNRNPELAGLTFFVNALNDGSLTVNNVAIAILDGAQGDDLATVNNKIEAANNFTAAIDTPDELAAYQGQAAIDAGNAYLDGVTDDEDSIPSEAATNAAIANIVTGTPSAGVGLTFTLTGGADLFSPNTAVEANRATSLDDTFRAVDGTLETADFIDGGAGLDTLVITSDILMDDAIAPVLRNIEVVTISNAVDATAIDFVDATGVERINIGAVAGGDLTLDTVDNGVDIALTGALTDDAIVNFQTVTGDQSETIVANGSSGAGVVVVNGVEELTIDATANSVVNLAADALEALVVTGTANVNLTGMVAANLETVDGSGAGGNITLDVTNVAYDELESIVTGGGKDAVTFAARADTAGLAVDTGANNDGITVVASGAAGNITDADEGDFADDMITVAFNGTQDFLTLDLNAPGEYRALTNAPADAAVEDAASLFAALNAAAGTLVGAFEATTFVFDGNTYVYVDNNNSGTFNVGDTVVELTGFTGDLTASNFGVI